MRNLRNVGFDSVPLPEGLPLTAKAWDSRKDAVVCAFGPTADKPVIELRRRHQHAATFETIASWDAPCPLPELKSDEVLLLQHFSGTSTSCLVLAGGDIVVVREEPSGDQERIEIVGSVDVGIAAAAWAADEELLAIVTRGDTLVLMSRDFEPVTETSLSAEDLKASKHVSVGWGKKETQFQGKRARALKDPTVPETVDEGKLSPSDDGRANISWRGDGQYFAVNSIVPGHRRVIRVFTREALLDSASEPVDGLESALSWRPYGNLIASVKRTQQKAEVVFFERNGLRHGEFYLRLSPIELETWASSISLEWNCDSSVLAIGFANRVQLWTMGNYHYYLKQEILLTQPGDLSRAPGLRAEDDLSHIPTVRARWHPISPLRLQISDDQDHSSLTYQFVVSRGSVVPDHDYGSVAVIDGKVLKLTPLRQAGVPPPMAFCEVQFEEPIVDCAIDSTGQRIAVLTTNHLELCRWDAVSSIVSTSTRLSKRFAASVIREGTKSLLPDLEIGVRSNPTQVEFCGDSVYVLRPASGGHPAVVYRPDFQENEPMWLVRTTSSTAAYQNLLVDPRYEHLAVRGSDGKVTLLPEGSNELDGNDQILPGNAASDVVLHSAAHISHLTSDPLLNGHSPVLQVFSLSTAGVLKLDNTILAGDCTSFIVTGAHLIFTTSQHLLKFVHLTNTESMVVPGNTPEVDERCRSIERGAELITVMPSAYAVVLQMPRGNIETIYPRVLVLAGIRGHIKQLDYKAAFLACQSQQVDMNILHDFQPQVFMQNTQRFIEQLKKPSRVDEFISKLKEEDVTETLYKDTLKASGEQSTDSKQTPTVPAAIQGKVNQICAAFISALEKLPPNPGFIQNIITAHVCKKPPDLESALTLVSRIHAESSAEADLAISHLCFLTDPNRLYNAALALYDLEVTLLVAQNAQRDPREYMPFLQDLHAMPVKKRQYTINNHLKKFSKALTSLHAMGDHEVVEKYTIKHSLYSDALSLYKYTPEQHDTITKHYAVYLAEKNSHLQAAILYDSLSLHDLAYPLYALAHAWRECLTSATLANIPEAQLTSLASSLATTLTDENRDYRSAAYIHEHYLSAPLEAANLLCKGSYFTDATLLLSRLRPSSIPTIIDPALSTQLAAILALLSDIRAQATSQSTRLTELRAIKAADPLAFYGGDATNLPDGADNIPDNISLAPTDMTTTTFANGSLFTRAGAGSSRFGGGTQLSTASRKTSKTKRKEERKRARGKKGSVYEEEYLVNSLARLLERWNGTHEEVKRLLAGLGRRGRREEGISVVEGMRDVEELLMRVTGEVWPAKTEGEGGVQLNGGGDTGASTRPSGADGVFWDSQLEVEGGTRRKEAPELKKWNGSEVFV